MKKRIVVTLILMMMSCFHCKGFSFKNTFSRWFRNGEKHIENLFDRVKKTSSEIRSTADKTYNKPLKLVHMTLRERVQMEAKNKNQKTKAIIMADLLDVIADEYTKPGFTFEHAGEIKMLIEEYIKNSKKVWHKVPQSFITKELRALWYLTNVQEVGIRNYDFNAWNLNNPELVSDLEALIIGGVINTEALKAFCDKYDLNIEDIIS